MPTALAGDASYARPSAADLKSVDLAVIGLYTGNARPTAEYIKSLLDGGIGVFWIQETFSERSLQGYQAGVLDAQYADRRVNEIAASVGLPPDTGTIWYCFSDGNAAVPSGDDTRNAMKEYARGIASATSRATFGAYGNRWAVDSATLGSSRCSGTWVPSSWGANNSDTLWQMANIANPLDSVDMDWVVRELSDIGAWGLAQNSHPADQEDEDMLYRTTDNGVQTYYRDAGGYLVPLGDQTGSYYGAVISGKITVIDLGGALGAIAFNAATHTAVSKVNPPSGGGTGSGLTGEEVHAIVRDELNKTKLAS